MATYHLSLKNGKTGTAKQHADYILREGRFSSGKRAEELVYKDANLPHWAMSASAFFRMQISTNVLMAEHIASLKSHCRMN